MPQRLQGNMEPRIFAWKCMLCLYFIRYYFIYIYIIIMKDINSSFKWNLLKYDSYLAKFRIKSFFSKVSMIEDRIHIPGYIWNIKFNSFISNTFLYFFNTFIVKKKQPMADSCSYLTEKIKFCKAIILQLKNK